MKDFTSPRRLVLIGSVIADMMTTVPALPARGGDVLAGPLQVQAGGGFNVLAAASRLGMPVALAGQVGTGPMGDRVAAELDGLGAELLLPRADGDTGVCIGLVEPDGERTFITSVGVESELSDGALASLAWRADDAVYVSGYDLCYPVSGPTIAAFVSTAKPNLMVLDPGPLIADIPTEVWKSVLSHTSVLTLNARELDLLMPGATPDADLRPLLTSLAPSGVAIVRSGARGCWLHTLDAATHHFPAPSVRAVDSTGAGDAHTGALLAELSAGCSLSDAVARATVAAAIAVSKVGSATGPTRTELDAALASR